MSSVFYCLGSLYGDQVPPDVGNGLTDAHRLMFMQNKHNPHKHPSEQNSDCDNGLSNMKEWATVKIVINVVMFT